MAKHTKKKHSVKFNGFEDEIHLSEFIDYDLDYKVGAMVLQKDINGPRKIKFGFETAGIHSCLDEKRFLQAFQKLEQGLKSLQFAENLTVKVSSFARSKVRVRQFSDLISKNKNPGIISLLKSDLEKVEELRDRGIRKPKTLRIYVTYTPDRTYERHGKGWQDKWFETLFAKVKDGVNSLDAKAVENRNKELFQQIYQSGFLAWQRQISESMGISCKALTADQLWAELHDEFSDDPAPPIPQVIRVTKNPADRTGTGIKYKVEVNQKLSAATVLTRSAVPQDHAAYVKVNDRYVGALTMVEKPMGWSSEREQLGYLWRLMTRKDAGDMQIVFQMSVDSEKSARKNLQSFSNQSTAKQKGNKKGSDRMAARKQQLAEDAEDSVLAGNIPLSVGITILSYQDTVSKLKESCANISAQFNSPAWVEREEKIAWKLWTQSLPTCYDRMLEKALYDRTLTFGCDEAMFAPWFKTGSRDTKGVEFLSETGESIFVDLFDVGNPLNMALFASTRSGKSVLVGSFLLQALANDIPIIALDYPKADGSSTFSAFTKMMGKDGAYYDISEESNNIFQQPDYSQIDPERVVHHKAHFLASLKQVTLSIVGSSGDNTLDNNVKTLLMPLVNEFLAKEGIQERYRLANEKGLGSDEWANTPTLHDFNKSVPFESDSEDTKRAYDYIHRRLDYWLKSEIADAIAKPSSFEADAKLIVFALTNIGDDEDAAILGLAAYSAAMRRSLSNPASIFFIDESPILFQFPMISQLIANLTANFGKSGGRVILTAQTVEAIAQSGHAAQILGNCKIKLTGCIESDQTDSFKKYLKMDDGQVGQCASEEFIRVGTQDWSNWMISYGGKMYRTQFYPGRKLLYSVVNNQDESDTRDWFMKYLPMDEALEATGLHLTECKKAEINPLDFLPSAEELEAFRETLEQLVARN